MEKWVNEGRAVLEGNDHLGERSWDGEVLKGGSVMAPAACLGNWFIRREGGPSPMEQQERPRTCSLSTVEPSMGWDGGMADGMHQEHHTRTGKDEENAQTMNIEWRPRDTKFSRGSCVVTACCASQLLLGDVRASRNTVPYSETLCSLTTTIFQGHKDD
ncbi:hypothetical protein E2C01_090563 [Portunus trituberculatus]|uniref:Uncharacterized protein n=1 Tax=Portunus trituberculatus TaxID=210409 RepID=A0A5B7JM38_PORTR|nr:hypothetical protein [Portunus trituberculatus]